ncbi:MAG: hypothetical protein HOD63_05855 [Bacteroidetes bacterium]|jgi:protein-S-isoprenylcysteine O-methyltransferase Ste14|nr:hypothetical protein [Bacteroidota bacterium]MBT4727095.1 hypothetical protein [Bacteroidota bacterium]MBT5528833.1 hypothetical protein [Cytophagia bacterium]
MEKEILSNLKKNNGISEYFSEVLLLALLLTFYSFGFYYGNLLHDYSKILLLVIYAFYIILILPRIIFVKKETGLYNASLIISIIKRFFKHVLYRNNYHSQFSVFKNDIEKHKFLFFLVKIIFIPIMLNFFVEYVIYLYEFFAQNAFGMKFILSDFRWFLLLSAIIFGIDTLYFSFGYLVEHKRFNNIVKSIDTSVLGWLVALACYKPFNNVTVRLFPMFADENVFFINKDLTLILYLTVIIFYVIYLLATFALGSKCSNLTNRGIVNKGVYRIIRHPAYASKVIAWWLLCIPIINIKVIISMFVWTTIYLLRAYTEEQHLLKDKDYQKYCKEVKWKFIPLIY